METPEEPRDPCQHWRGTLRFWPPIEMRTATPAVTGEESQEAPHNSYGESTFLRPQEGVPVIPTITREEPQVSCRNSRKIRRFSPQCEMRPFSSEASQENSHCPSRASKGSLTPLMLLKKLPNIPASTREKQRGSCQNSRRAPFFPLHLKMRVPFLASSGKESWCSSGT